MRDATKAGHACLVIDGTVIPVDRVAADRPFYSGKHCPGGLAGWPKPSMFVRSAKPAR